MGGSRSRIDQIYIKENILNHSLDWHIEDPDVQTDHKLISCKIYNYNAPSIGKGRWAIPKYILDDINTIKKIEKIGMNITENAQDPQSNLQCFISETYKLTRDTDKIK